MSAATAKPARWRIGAITIGHFRGVAREHTFEFNGLPGLLHGRNGVGKSTVALGLQWILYGKFPDGVLANTRLDSFLSPVGAKGKVASSGKVVLTRGKEKLVVSRDGKLLSLVFGGETWSGDEAEAKRDALLATDMDTFSRAVLLHQSRVRGLLMDEVAERNRCLDRLLGMDDVEHLVALVKPKPFSDAARQWRAKIQLEQQKLTERERLLGEQLEEAQQRARELKFLNKDLNPSGLRTRYAELSADVVALAKRHGLAVEALPSCDAPSDSTKVANAFRARVQSVRIGSELEVRLAPIETAIATLTSHRQRWAPLVASVEKAKLSLLAAVEKHGDRTKLLSDRADAQVALEAAKRALKSANELRELLNDALAYTRPEAPSTCPVCEQQLPRTLDLRSRLEARVAAVGSDEIARLEQARREAEQRILALDAAVKFRDALEVAEKDAQKALDSLRHQVVEALGGSGIAENKIAARLEEALTQRAEDRAKLAKGIEAMEQEIGAIELRERTISGALAEAVRKRAELEKHEEMAKKAKAAFAKDEERALRMEQRAAQLDVIRKALLETKQEIAGETLEKARPRAQELYAKLVRHPVFDTLDIHATPRAGKVDYTFEVSTGGASATARDARHVLSDGQLTAAALALFFGLAESTSHELDVLYVDDPTQNLDLPSKEAMAKVVAEMSERRQVIVSTQDEDFVTALESGGFKDRGVVHRITAWNGNPTVKTEAPF